MIGLSSLGSHGVGNAGFVACAARNLYADGCHRILQARPDADGADVQAGGSVPGAVTHTPGGVARNIAAALAQRLGCGGCLDRRHT